ncbi:efflux RND transporter periplasmic adaptor subunit [Aquaspirillum sp. LM1]|uniref:efflux RND transporter periplasmic adaptor subunit n=1 Tax=Aquaspirillum sp. LM1 TaxID=1938604 RepID=UPI00209B526C|nr:efflux RND transporter periplasmic adaptor subunit [Aquaspirillum sp. LM1]
MQTGLLSSRRWMAGTGWLLGGLAALALAAPTPVPTAAGHPVLKLSVQDVVQVQRSTLADSLPFTGTLQALRATTLAARTEGVAVEVRVREGESVQAGQVLARLEATDLQERVNEQTALVATERARLALTRKKLDKQRELYAQNFISKLAFDELESNFLVSQAQLQAQEAQLARARKALNDATIRAPFAGVIYEKAINPGQRVAVNNKLFALADLSTLEIAASVPSRQIGRVAIGQAAQFGVEGGQAGFAGQVVRINPVALAGTRSFTVFVAVDNRQGQLRGGQFVKGALVLRQASQVLSLPIPALRDSASAQPWVLKLVGQKAVRQPVQLGVHDERANRVEIRSGLKDGEQVLLAGVLGVQDGDTVALPTVPAR